MTRDTAVKPLTQAWCYVCGRGKRVIDGLCERCRREEQEKNDEFDD
jgi:NMD protein affecting ribosome stability and mRNA decay